MAISLASIRTARADGPPRLLIYGTPGIGKTTLASEFPNAIFLQVEDGTPGETELASFGLLKTYADFMDALYSLVDGEHDFKTVVIDSATALQKLIFQETCDRGDDKGNRKENIEDFGYGKGYIYSQRITDEVLDGLTKIRDKGIATVIIAHSKIERFDDPETVSYDRYEIDLHDKLRGAFEREVDAILLMKAPVTIKTEKQGFDKERARADGSGTQVWIHAIQRPAYTAKNRYGIPERFLYIKGRGFTELTKYLPNWLGEGAPAEEAAADPASAKQDPAGRKQKAAA